MQLSCNNVHLACMLRMSSRVRQHSMARHHKAYVYRAQAVCDSNHLYIGSDLDHRSRSSGVSANQIAAHTWHTVWISVSAGKTRQVRQLRSDTHLYFLAGRSEKPTSRAPTRPASL